MGQSSLRRAIVFAIATRMLMPVNGALAQAIPRDLRAWQLDFTIMGTIRGLNEHLTLNQAGELTAEHPGPEHDQVSGHASPELLSKVKTWLQLARAAKSDKGPSFPDALLLSAVLTANGRQYPLQMPADLYRPLQDAFNTLFSQALLGTWRQSAWKLCTPVNQLQASDIDPPIDDLTFRPDATFTVTWRGGGAHTLGIPHTSIPDYQGHYDAHGESGYISMQVDGGIVAPRDFSGDGHFTITSDRLILHDIWLGTRQAKSKPDICELIFSRDAKPATPGSNGAAKQ